MTVLEDLCCCFTLPASGLNIRIRDLQFPQKVHQVGLTRTQAEIKQKKST